MKKIIFFISLIFMASFFLNVSSSFAFDDVIQRDNTNVSIKVFENLENEFLALRNSDPYVNKINEWETLAVKLETFFNKNERLSQSAQAMYDAVVLYEELYKKVRAKNYLDRAFIVIEKFLKDYNNHYLADDILIKKGDINFFLLEDIKSAKECYQNIINDYENTDMYELAKARLRMIQEKESGISNEKIVQNEDANNQKEDKFKASKFTIVLDPGHGGEEGGAKNQSGLYEKDLTLDMALRLEKILKQNTGFQVYLTRRTDKFVSLGERTELANVKKADLFISLHINASLNKNAYGIETYYLDNTDDKSSRKLAERENKSLTFGSGKVDDLQFILSDLIQSAKQEESIVLANTVQKELMSHLDKRWRGIKDLGVKKAPFYVLVGAHMPCILVETLFIDNYQDAKKLANENFRQDVAHALYVAILRFFDEK